jgi:hypothetical protein
MASSSSAPIVISDFEDEDSDASFKVVRKRGKNVVVSDSESDAEMEEEGYESSSSVEF